MAEPPTDNPAREPAPTPTSVQELIPAAPTPAPEAPQTDPPTEAKAPTELPPPGLRVPEAESEIKFDSPLDLIRNLLNEAQKLEEAELPTDTAELKQLQTELKKVTNKLGKTKKKIKQALN